MPVEEGLSAGELLALYEAAEEAGYHTALCGEVAGAEVLSLMGMAAARTSRIRLGSGILATYTRPAPLAAMGFATLASAAPGRIVAGFGASSPIIVGRWHGIPFNKPFTTTREYLELFGRVMAGGKISYAGEKLTCDGFRLQMRPPSPVPVWLGAMGDRMLALAGEVADGAFLAWCPPGEVAAKRQIIHQAARAAGRDPQAVELVCSFWGYAGDRPDEARERMRRSLLAYAMVPTHQHCFAGCFPYLEEAAEGLGGGRPAPGARLRRRRRGGRRLRRGRRCRAPPHRRVRGRWDRHPDPAAHGRRRRRCGGFDADCPSLRSVTPCCTP